MYTIFDASATTENSPLRTGSDEVASLMVLEVVGAGWTGTIKVTGRVIGRGAGTFRPLAIKNRNDETVIPGDTGITGDGIYEVNVAGLEVRFEHTRSAGAVSVYAQPVVG